MYKLTRGKGQAARICALYEANSTGIELVLRMADFAGGPVGRLSKVC